MLLFFFYWVQGEVGVGVPGARGERGDPGPRVRSSYNTESMFALKSKFTLCGCKTKSVFILSICLLCLRGRRAELAWMGTEAQQ